MAAVWQQAAAGQRRTRLWTTAASPRRLGPSWASEKPKKKSRCIPAGRLAAITLAVFGA